MGSKDKKTNFSNRKYVTFNRRNELKKKKTIKSCQHNLIERVLYNQKEPPTTKKGGKLKEI